MAWKVQTGAAVRYRSATGRVQHAIVTGVTSQSVIALRVGNGSTKLTKTGMNLLTAHGTTEGWFRVGKGLT